MSLKELKAKEPYYTFPLTLGQRPNSRDNITLASVQLIGGLSSKLDRAGKETELTSVYSPTLAKVSSRGKVLTESSNTRETGTRYP